MVTAIFFSIDSSSWIQAFGGLIGAFLAGYISITIFNRQVKNEFKKDVVKTTEDYLKVSINLHSYIESCISLFSQLISDEMKAASKENQLELFKMTFKNLHYFEYEINKVNEDKIPYIIYPEFVKIKKNISHLGYIVEFMQNSIQESVKPSPLMLEKKLKDLIIDSKTMKDFNQKNMLDKHQNNQYVLKKKRFFNK